MAKDISATVREVCLWLPEAEEATAHGSATFKVRGKTFAMYLVNHQLVREAYEHVAPATLAKTAGKTPEIQAPTKKLAPEDIDPLQSRRAQAVLSKVRGICLALPESSEATQFGSPVWRAGKKTFANLYADGKRLLLAFWVGTAQQTMFTADPRYHVPAYVGHNGWIALDISKQCNWAEVRAQLLHSYRHFALKRMLARISHRDRE